MEQLFRDVRIALRGLRRRPVFTFVAVLSLALGIGANGTVFSLVHGMLFRPLPGVVDGDRLVRITAESPSFDFPLGVAAPTFVDLGEAGSDLFESTTAQIPTILGASIGGDAPRVVFALGVLGDYFETLGTLPSVGRLFTGAEVRTHSRGVVVSHAFWLERLAGDPEAVGTLIELNGDAFEVVGVAPEGFGGTEVLVPPDLWVPLTSAETMIGGPDFLQSRESRGLRMTARLRPGVEIEQVAAALETISARFREEYPEETRGDEHRVMPENDARLEAGLGDASKIFGLLLLALVGGVLLIACANVANLLLARADSRRKEIAVRVAIGAGRGHLIRQHLVENLLIAAGGGAAGIALAFAAARYIAAYRPPGNVPVRLAAEPDMTVLFFLLALTLLSGLVFGLAPAFRGLRVAPAGVLRSTPEGSGGRKLALGSVLVVVQVALSLVLLVAAGLFLRSLGQATQVDLGFDAEGLGVVSFDIGTAGLDEAEGRVFLDRLERRLQRVPGVEQLTIASSIPMDWSAGGIAVRLDHDISEQEGDQMIVLSTWADASTFETLGIPILRGRGFTEVDDADHPRVLIVNEAFAEKVWPNEAAVGKTVRLGGVEAEVAEVVGVVPTGKYRMPAEGPRPYAFVPRKQEYRSYVSVAVQSRGSLVPLLETLRREVLSLEPRLAIQDAQPYEATISSRVVGPISMVASLAGAFGLIGLTLAAIGLYGVMALQVVRRTREVGIRMALGARRAQVVGGVLGRGLRLSTVGLLVGAVLAAMMSQVIGSFLVGVSPNDPWTAAGVIVILTIVAVLASLVPALRAARIDPVRTLKAD